MQEFPNGVLEFCGRGDGASIRFEIVKDLGLFLLSVDNDALMVVQEWSWPSRSENELGLLVQEARLAAQAIGVTICSYVPDFGNTVAHSIAKLALTFNHDSI
ncbi:hypothetical protein Ancab_021262 [Ancistrocladus abbreviatus]